MIETFKKGVPTINTQASKTQQHFEPEANINAIMARFRQTGELPSTSNNFGTYADVSNIPDFHAAQNVVRDAQSKFAQLPSQIRDRFQNSPQALLTFLQNKNNRAEAIELGLINPDPVPKNQPVPTPIPPKKETTPSAGPVPT